MASFQAACRRKMYTQRSVSSSAVSNIFSICSLRTLFTCMSMEKPPSNNLLTFEEGHRKIFMPFFFLLWWGNKDVGSASYGGQHLFYFSISSANFLTTRRTASALFASTERAAGHPAALPIYMCFNSVCSTFFVRALTRSTDRLIASATFSCVIPSR